MDNDSISQIVNSMTAPLQASGIWLVPTGSRFFGTATGTSDYDFYLWDDEVMFHEEKGLDLFALLEILGWENLSSTQYYAYARGSSIRRTYRKTSGPVTVDIMVVSDILTLIKARNLIKASGITIDKQKRDAIWSLASKLVTSLNEDVRRHATEILSDYVQSGKLFCPGL